MLSSFKKKLFLLAGVLLFTVPSSAYAIFDLGGWVLNIPGSGGIMSAAAVSGWIYPPCVNGVNEVDILQAAGVPQPPIFLQFMGHYTFMKGPASHSGQQILGKYSPVPMVCIAIYLVPCGIAVCPTPLPFFFAPLIIFNGSSI